MPYNREQRDARALEIEDAAGLSGGRGVTDPGVLRSLLHEMLMDRDELVAILDTTSLSSAPGLAELQDINRGLTMRVQELEVDMGSLENDLRKAETELKLAQDELAAHRVPAAPSEG